MVNPDKLLRILGEVHKNSGQKRTLEREERMRNKFWRKSKRGLALFMGITVSLTSMNMPVLAAEADDLPSANEAVLDEEPGTYEGDVPDLSQNETDGEKTGRTKPGIIYHQRRTQTVERLPLSCSIRRQAQIILMKARPSGHGRTALH